MSAFSRRWFASFAEFNPHQRRVNGFQKRYSPRLETLEDRTVPATIFQVTSPDAAGLASTLSNFKAELGGATITVSNQPSNATGSREITWEDVGGNPATFTGDYFNTTVRRGIVFTVNGSTDSSHFAVSDNGFADIDPSYPNTFQAFSPPRMFAPRGTNITDINFRDPNSPATPATVKGFGLVFCDVDQNNFTSLTLFDSNNNVLLGGPIYATAQNGGFSFVGAIFTDGERIDHIEVTTGNAALAPGNNELADPSIDVVAMDNVIYAQPQPIATRIYRWLDVDGNWNDPANWQQTSGTVDPNQNNRFPNGTGEVAVFGSNLTMAHTVTIPDAANVTVGAIQVDTSQNVDFTTGTGKVIFQAAGNTSADAALDVTDLNGHGTITFDTPIQLNRNWEVSTVNAGSLVQLNGIVSDTASRSIVKRGAGTVGFGGGVTDSFAGPLSVQGGTSQVDAAFSNSSVALNGGTLSGAGTVKGLSVQNTGNTIAPGTALTTGSLTSSQSVTWDGNTTFFVKLRNGGNDQFVLNGNGSAGNINLGGAQLQLNLSGFVPAPNSTFTILQVSGALTGQFAQGSFIVADNQLFSLHYSGQTVIATKVNTVNIAITPQPATIVFGQSYSVLATVSSASGNGPIPTGNVTFALTSGGNTFTSGNIALVNGQATLNSDQLPSLPVGSYNISVSYLGSPEYQASTTPLLNGLTVNKADVAVSLSPVSAITGELVQMTATIAVQQPGNGMPDGNVHFVLTLGAQIITQDVPVQHQGGQNTATFMSNTLLPGIYSVTAEYQDTTGSFNNNTSTPAMAIISQANVNFQLDNNPTSRYGDLVTYTAHVSSVVPGSVIPVGGNVHFQIFPLIGGPAVVDVQSPVQNGIATVSAPATLPVGQYQVQADYLGDVAYLPAGPQTIVHTISSALTTVNVVLQSPQPGTPTFGQQLTFRAQVSANNGNAGIPNGTVSFVLVLPDGSPNINSGPIVLTPNGTADFSPIQVLPPTEQRSPIQVHVTYNGDDNQQRFAAANNDANPLLQTVLRPNTATTLTISRVSDHATSGIRYAENVQLSAAVAVTGLDFASTQRAGTPRGNIQFVYLRGTTEVPLGSPVTLNALGTATLDTYHGSSIRLPGGIQTFRAYYVDTQTYHIYNASNTQSSTTIVPQAVTAEMLSVRPATGSSTPNNVYAYGRSLIFSVHYRFVNPVAAGTLITGDPVQTAPTGTGQFRFTIGTTIFETANINLVAPPATTSPRAPAAQPFSTLTFTSSALFSTSIANRTLGTNLSLVLPSGNYHGNVFVNYTSSNAANFESFGFDRVQFDTFMLTIQTASVGRRWTR